MHIQIFCLAFIGVGAFGDIFGFPAVLLSEWVILKEPLCGLFGTVTSQGFETTWLLEPFETVTRVSVGNLLGRGFVFYLYIIGSFSSLIANLSNLKTLATPES